jgi:hypothetical protein
MEIIMAEITQDAALEIAQEETRKKDLGELEASFMAGMTIARAIVGKEEEYAKILDELKDDFCTIRDALLILVVAMASLRRRPPEEIATFLGMWKLKRAERKFSAFMGMPQWNS